MVLSRLRASSRPASAAASTLPARSVFFPIRLAFSVIITAAMAIAETAKATSMVVMSAIPRRSRSMREVDMGAGLMGGVAE